VGVRLDSDPQLRRPRPQPFEMVVSRCRGIGPPSSIPSSGLCFCWPPTTSSSNSCSTRPRRDLDRTVFDSPSRRLATCPRGASYPSPFYCLIPPVAHTRMGVTPNITGLELRVYWVNPIYIYIYMCVCMCVCVCIYTYNIHIYMYTYIYIYMDACIYTNFVYLSTSRISASMSIYVYLYICISIYLQYISVAAARADQRLERRRSHMYICICIYVCVYIYIYIYIHIFCDLFRCL